MRRLVCLLMLLAACGGAGEEPTTVATTTTVAPTTSAATTTFTTAVPTTVPGESAGWFAVYFFLPTAGEEGARLVPVYRAWADVPGTEAPEADALFELFRGPSADEAGAGVSSEIAPGTRLLGFTGEGGGLATLDLSSDFAAGASALSLQARLAQVVYTVTQFPGVERLRFALDGEPVTVFPGTGLRLADPAGRVDFATVVPAVQVEEPAFGAEVLLPLAVRSVARAPDRLGYALTDWDGVIIAEGTVAVGAEPVSFTIEADEPELGLGSLVFWSVLDGSRRDVLEYPLRLVD